MVGEYRVQKDTVLERSSCTTIRIEWSWNNCDQEKCKDSETKRGKHKRSEYSSLSETRSRRDHNKDHLLQKA